MQVKQICLQRALAMLNAAGCAYCVVEADGTKHGTLEVAAVKKPVRVKGLFPYGALRNYYLPFVEKMEVGGAVTIPYATFGSTPDSRSALRGAISSWCSANWGNQTYLTHMAKDGVELVRVS